MNLKRGPATTAPRGSLHPFRPGQISNPYAGYYRPPFAYSAFSYPLVQQIPSRVTCLAKPLARADNWTYHVPVFADPNALRVYPFSARLFPGSVMTAYSQIQGEQPAAYLLVWAR
jgi:hypothetical protein